MSPTDIRTGHRGAQRAIAVILPFVVAGVLAALSGGLWFDYFLTEPTGQLAVNDRDDIEVAVLLVVVGVAVAEIAHWGCASRRARLSEPGSSTVCSRARTRRPSRASTSRTPGGEWRSGSAPSWTSTAAVSTPARRPAGGVAMLLRDGTVERDGYPVVVEREGLPIDVEIVLAVPGPAADTGHFRLTAASRVRRPKLEQRRVAVLLAAQCASLPPHH